MMKNGLWAPKLQFVFYLIETLLVAGLLALAADNSPQFALGPLVRILVAAVLPLPCHLLWLAHFLWLGHRRRPRAAAAARPTPRPLPWAPPAPASARHGEWIGPGDSGKQLQPSVAG